MCHKYLTGPPEGQAALGGNIPTDHNYNLWLTWHLLVNLDTSTSNAAIWSRASFNSPLSSVRRSFTVLFSVLMLL